MLKYLNAKIKKKTYLPLFFKKNTGFTLIDILVGSALMLIVFLGFFSAFQLAIETLGYTKSKVIATAIANQQIELIRNLPYKSIGVVGGHPDGILEPTESTILNNIEFIIKKRVDFVINPIDGIIYPDDSCPKDYKKAEVSVSWPGLLAGEVVLVINIAPKNIVEECDIDGGILSIYVFDAHGEMINFPLIEIKDPTTNQIQKMATPESGYHYFALSASTYKVVVSKLGYSTSRTYSIDEVAIPKKPHLMVLDGQITKNSFSIDKASTFSIKTFSPSKVGYFSDFFDDLIKIFELLNITVAGGEVRLAIDSVDYFPSGHLISEVILPINIIQWDKLIFNDSKPLNTDIKYQVYYYTINTGWSLISDVDLPGNLEGFNYSPIDLSNLSVTTYSKLRIRANLTTQDLNISPTLKDWQLIWIYSEAMLIFDIPFNLQGSRIIGYDGDGNPVYKYSQNHISDGDGYIEITNLKWDSYTFLVDSATTGLHLVNTNPLPQPISLLPNTTLPINLYLEADNCLLITVKDKQTLEPIFDANITLSKNTFSKIQHTNTIGQTYFFPLEIATYGLEVSAPPGYLATSVMVLVSGKTLKIIKLERVE